MFAAGVVAERPQCVPFHAGLGDSRDFSDRFTFAFVCHPLDFWLPTGVTACELDGTPDNGIDALAGSNQFDQSAARRLVEMERASIERFYAHDPIPSHLVGRRAPIRAPVVRRLERCEIELRDARAELAVTQRSERQRETLLEAYEQELAQASEALCRLRESRLLRWSRPLRLAWYACKPVAPRAGRPHTACRSVESHGTIAILGDRRPTSVM